jgi:hypothetical protein
MSFRSTQSKKLLRHSAMLALLVPLTMGAEGDGCSPSTSRSEAPDVTGDWEIRYDDTIAVTIQLGGAIYEASVGVAGGNIEITHDGQPLMFNLDCARPEIVCPSEAWPSSIRVEQRLVQFEHRMIVSLPGQSCSGDLVAPDPEECGDDTLNVFCDKICDGEITLSEGERFGVISENGLSFDLLLGAGIATNGVNCALLGFSYAYADLVNSGEGSEEWRSEEMSNGGVTVAYGGACLYAGDPDMDGELEALLLDASIEFDTGFTGSRVQ